MDTKFTPELKDTTCGSCFCKDQKFLHHVWDGDKGSKICTSCVLFANKQSFCPTCFDGFSGGDVICCERCESLTHDYCFPGNSSRGAPFACATCRDSKRLVFRLSDLKVKGDNGHNKGIDMHAARLLLTAAKIVQRSISKARDEANDSAMKQVLKAVWSKKKAQRALKRVLKFDESTNDGPSLIDDSTDSEEDSSPETLSETGRLQRLSIEGAPSGVQSGRMTMRIDLNEEYPSEYASF